LFARSTGGAFLVRIEDLDPATSSDVHEASQLKDLAALGLDWDGDPIRQSGRRDDHEAAVTRMQAAGLTYPCYCTRREIREAAAAPHNGPMPDGAYPGTCRQLTASTQAAHERDGRPAALRLRAQVASLTVDDDLAGPVTAAVDDFVLRRNDGLPAYNLAVVADDDAQGIEQVVRGADLLTSAPRQRHLADLLGLAPVRYAHVPLVVTPDGRRLAKRDGAVTLAQQADRGVGPDAVRRMLAESLGIDPAAGGAPLSDLAAAFDPRRVPADPWVPPPMRDPVD
jgi:glutamyl-tRNA synthetase